MHLGERLLPFGQDSEEARGNHRIDGVGRLRQRPHIALHEAAVGDAVRPRPRVA